MTADVASDAPAEVLLELTGMRKSYGRVAALRDGNISVARGEVVALVGDNGAGKSTLLRIISGAQLADEGTARFNGLDYAPRSPKEARLLGIETVYQNLGLLDNIDVTANLFLGRELRHQAFGRDLPLLKRKAMKQRAAAILDRYALKGITPNRSVAQLSGGQRQMLAIARAAEGGAQLILMDEPTAALGIQESKRVLDLILALKERGVAVVIVCHNMDHVYSVADRAVVLRRGETVGNFSMATASQTEVVHAIVGAEFTDASPRA